MITNHLQEQINKVNKNISANSIAIREQSNNISKNEIIMNGIKYQSDLAQQSSSLADKTVDIECYNNDSFARNSQADTTLQPQNE